MLKVNNLLLCYLQFTLKKRQVSGGLSYTADSLIIRSRGILRRLDAESSSSVIHAKTWGTASFFSRAPFAFRPWQYWSSVKCCEHTQVSRESWKLGPTSHLITWIHFFTINLSFGSVWKRTSDSCFSHRSDVHWGTQQWTPPGMKTG